MNHENVVKMFERCALEHAGRSAIRHRDRSVSYKEFESRANQLANYLKAAGVPKGALIAILVADPVTAITSILGILKAGCAFVPLDTTTPEKRLAPMVTLTRPEWFIVEPNLVDLAVNITSNYDSLIKLISTREANLPEVDNKRFTLLKGLGEQLPDHRPNIELGPDDLCYIYFTSGSTGEPKAIAGRLKGIDHFIRWEIETLGVNERTRVSQLLAHSFDGSLRDIFVPLCSGGTICVPPDKEVLRDIPGLIDWIDAEQINIIHCVPSLFRAIGNEELRPELFSSLQYVLMAGEALLPSDVKRWLDVFGERIQLINLYGTSETTMAKFIYFVKPSDTERRFISIGRPMEGAAVLLVDEKGRPCPQGTIGEIYIRTPYRSLGYYNQPELTTKAFIRNPFSEDPNDIVYRTGDMGRIREDGNYEFLGRRDQQVKVRGVRVELEEIEDLLRAHEGVKDVAVIDRQDGSDFNYLCAYVVFSNGTDPAELRAYAAAWLQDYMVPSAFIAMDELPRTISGKVDRRALPAVKSRQRGKLEPGRTPIEELLCGIWGEVLGLPEVGRAENFFELGGHSLSATRVMARVRAVTGQTLALRELFEAPTVAQLAARLERAQSDELGDEPALQRRLAQSTWAPLSSAQQRLWFIDQLEPGSAAYNIPVAVRLHGQLNHEGLRGAFTELVRRQEALRTIFPIEDGEPVQVVQAATAWSLLLVDLRGHGEAEREKELSELAAAEAERGFDLAQGPLLRSTLVQLSEQEHVLLLVMHHIISDGWSLGVLVQELTRHYENCTSSGASELPELELQYADYAVWQRAWLASGKLKEQLQYWQERLAEAPPLLELPLDRARGAVLSYRGGAVSVELGEELSQGLKEVAWREGATLFMVLLAAFKALLYRYTGQSDLVVGTAEAGRLRPELEAIIGLFVNTLALRTQLSGKQSFAELLRSVRETALSAYAHRELPFDTMVEHVQPDRSLSHHPLFQVMFVVQNTPAVPISVSGLTASILAHRTVAAKFDLNFHLGETSSGFAGHLYYNRDLFDSATAERLISHYQQLLRSALADLNQPLAKLQILPAEEHQKMLGWSRTRTEELNRQCIHRQFEEQVAKTPGATAVIYLDQQLSFEELNRRANQLAHYLRKNGVRPETVVGIHMPPSVDSIVGLLGILKAGGAYVGLDPMLPAERLDFMVTEANVTLVLTGSEITTAFSTSGVGLVLLDTISEALAKESTDNPDVDVAWENLAYVIYTSGSTGRPKGVAGAHRQLAAYLTGILDRLHFVPGASFTMHQSLSVDAPVTQLLVTLCRGGVLHIIPQELATDPDALGEYFQTNRIDYFKVAPSLLAALQASAHPERVMPRRLVLIGGEAAHTDWVRSIQPLAPACAIVNHYGPTETTVGVMTYEVSNDVNEMQAAILPLGRPLPNAEIYLLDPAMNPVPVGIAAEIHIGGETLSRGYLNSPQLTAVKFIPNPFSDTPGARLYKTGDLARYLPDGNVEFLGRIDHQIKVRGFRVELGEIEAVIMEYPAVQGAAVLKWESAGVERLVAYVVANPATPELPGELAQFLRNKLPDYMIPSVFLMLDALPHTAQGKIDRHALPAPEAWQPELEFTAPRTETEKRLAEIWAQLLGLPRVGVFDNFFELGGHSLLATRLISRLRETLHVELPLRAIFEEPTVAGLSSVIDRLAENGMAAAAMAAPSVAAVSRLDRRTKLSELRKNMG